MKTLALRSESFLPADKGQKVQSISAAIGKIAQETTINKEKDDTGKIKIGANKKGSTTETQP